MKTLTSYNGTNLITHIHNPDEENIPSVKFGPIFFASVFLGLVWVSAMLAVVIVYCSRKQEQLIANNKLGKKPQCHLRPLVCLYSNDMHAMLVLRPCSSLLCVCKADTT
jgi:hypothetical protein